MAAFNKINDYVEDVAHKVHNLGSDALTVALSNTAPGSETSDPSADGNGVLANVTQIAYTNVTTFDADDGTETETNRVATLVSSAQTAGTYKLTLKDMVIKASGGSVGPFRYVYLYNDTAVGDPLIGYYDRGESITLADGEDLTIDFDDVNGVLTLA